MTKRTTFGGAGARAGAMVILIAAATGRARADEVPGPTELIVYGDTRGGILQDIFSNAAVRARAIHVAVAKQIGALKGLGPSRGILFVGDAVSVGGCRKLWEPHFLSVLPSLCPAFCAETPGGSPQYSFFPVVGDHETWDLPKTLKDATTEQKCGGYETLALAQLEMDTPRNRALISEHIATGEDCREWKSFRSACEDYRAMLRREPDVESLKTLVSKCDRCEYQEDVAHGNINAFVFNEMYTRAARFGPFAEKRGAKAATWYSLDYRLRNKDGGPRLLRVLMIDTQTDPDLRIQTESGSSESQADWVRAAIGSMPSGSVLIVVGHQTPSTTDSPDEFPRRLFELAITEAAHRGVRTAAIAAGHHHTYGQGEFELRVPGCSAQRVIAVLSGDGGARDAGFQDESAATSMISGAGIGTVHSTLISWQRGEASRRLASFAKLTLTGETVSLTPYQVHLRRGRLDNADPDEKKLLRKLRLQGNLRAPSTSETKVYESVVGSLAGRWAVDPLGPIVIDLQAEVTCSP